MEVQCRVSVRGGALSAVLIVQATSEEVDRVGKGADLTPPVFLRLLPLIAQRPVMARWNRDAESIYKLKETMRNYVTERSQAISGYALFDLF